VLAEELQLAMPVGHFECFEEAPAEQAREHAHRQEEAGPAVDPALTVRRESATGDDAAHMRVMCERRAPGVQYERGANLGAEMPGIAGDRAQRVGRDVEQQAVDNPFVIPGDRTDGRGKREDDVEVLDRKQIGLACGQPAVCGAGLALRAMPVPARNGGLCRTKDGGTRQFRYGKSCLRDQ